MEPKIPFRLMILIKFFFKELPELRKSLSDISESFKPNKYSKFIFSEFISQMLVSPDCGLYPFNTHEVILELYKAISKDDNFKRIRIISELTDEIANENISDKLLRVYLCAHAAAISFSFDETNESLQEEIKKNILDCIRYSAVRNFHTVDMLSSILTVQANLLIEIIKKFS